VLFLCTQQTTQQLKNAALLFFGQKPNSNYFQNRLINAVVGVQNYCSPLPGDPPAAALLIGGKLLQPKNRQPRARTGY